MRVALLSLFLVGCGPITRIGDKIIGLTTPVLVGGMVVGTEPPDDPQLAAALEAQGIGQFTAIQLVVADALEFKDIDNALITDAGVSIETGQSLVLPVEDDGWYRVEGETAPSYEPGATWTVSADLPDRVLPGSVVVELPEAAEVSIPEEVEVGETVTIDLEGQGFEAAFAVVFDSDGNQVWTNAPLDTDSIIDLVLPSSDPVRRVTIPGEAFPTDDVYVVGVAGLRRSPDEGIEGLNEALTAVFAGQMKLEPVTAGEFQLP